MVLDRRIVTIAVTLAALSFLVVPLTGNLQVTSLFAILCVILRNIGHIFALCLPYRAIENVFAKSKGWGKGVGI